MLPLIYPLIRDGQFKSAFLQKRMAKRQADSYVTAFLEMLGDPRPYVTLGSCKNQFYSDLIPAMYRLDYTKAGGVTDFVRQYTLTGGGPYCDCGYHKKRT